MFQFLQKSQKLMMPTVETALPGRPDPIPTAERHFVSNRRLADPYPDGLSVISLGMGCFWGAERCLWQIPGVYVTMAGYQGGLTPNPTYEETITGLTGHAEVVRVVFNSAQLTLADLLGVFFEAHDPTQGMRQGNDVGTTYRSVIFADSDDDLNVAVAMKNRFQKALDGAGHGGSITTEIAGSGPFYFAEAYHQQYLAKNPSGYCGLRGTGISCPLPAQG